jgi:biotin carboxyl carrier protein
MKLKAELGEHQFDLTIHRDGQTVSADVDGRPYECEVREHPAGLLLIESNHVYDCRVSQRDAVGATVTVSVGTTTYDVSLSDPKRLRSAIQAAGQDHGAAALRAPMPGKVVRVLVAVGTTVEPGTGLVVVEAMKMQNELKSPKAGTVTSIAAVPGATVNAGEVLAVVE